MSAALTIRAATIGHRRDVPVLRDVAFEVAPGERVAILGGNGAGKTTLLKTAVGLLQPGGGEVRIFGCAIRTPRESALAGAGILFQNPADQLFAATVQDDVAFGPRNQGLPPAEVAIRTGEALACAGLTSLAHRAIEALSFGEQRRACLAGILAMRPRLLLLDEPTAGADPSGELEVVELLQAAAAAGTTVVAATHAVDLVPLLADRLVVLGEGRILADGPARRIFADAPLLARARLRAPAATQLWRALAPAGAEPGAVPLTLDEVAQWASPRS